MAVDERGDQSAIDVAGNGDVIRLRSEESDGFVTIPVTLELMTVFVEPATAIAMTEFFGIVILKGFFITY